MTNPNDFDPLAEQPKRPNLSFKDAPVGTVRVLWVTEFANLVHSRDYETNELAYWDDQKTQPVMAVVINGLDEQGQPASIWATRPSELQRALTQGQKDAGVRIGPGGKLEVQFTGEKPNENPRKAPQKLYAVRYTPNAFTPPPSGPDPVSQGSGFDQPQAQAPAFAQPQAQAPAFAQPQAQAPVPQVAPQQAPPTGPAFGQQPQFQQPAAPQAQQAPFAQPQAAPAPAAPADNNPWAAAPAAPAPAAPAAPPQGGQPPFAPPQGSEQQPPY